MSMTKLVPMISFPIGSATLPTCVHSSYEMSMTKLIPTASFPAPLPTYVYSSYEMSMMKLIPQPLSPSLAMPPCTLQCSAYRIISKVSRRWTNSYILVVLSRSHHESHSRIEHRQG